MRDGFNRLIRFSRFVNTAAQVRLDELDAHVDLVITGPEKFPDFSYAAIDLGMAVFLRMCQITAGHTLYPVRVTLQRPQPDNTSRFDDLLFEMH